MKYLSIFLVLVMFGCSSDEESNSKSDTLSETGHLQPATSDETIQPPRPPAL
ncbi:MAG: hypothetical protein U9N39_10785 [Campylobacterota bacterium]|nr:hypothetical protein [Campylobacterota bacterium]